MQRRLNSSDLISDTVSLRSQYGAWVSLLLGRFFLDMEINFNFKWESHTGQGDIFCWIESKVLHLWRERGRGGVIEQ